MKILGVIPARYASTRFEGKPLKDINGNPMIEWVYRRAENSSVDDIVVATDDIRIFNTVKNFGGNVVMTSSDHENGTSRIVEVISRKEYENYDFIINIQGDEPLISIESVNMLTESFRQRRYEIITLKKKITEKKDVNNPDIVKVVTDFNGNALYFSRSVIPYKRNMEQEIVYYKHIGIYGYTPEFLKKLKSLRKGVLEVSESLEQLRFLENGYRIKVLETDAEVIGVDTPCDLEEVIKYVREKNIKLECL